MRRPHRPLSLLPVLLSACTVRVAPEPTADDPLLLRRSIEQEMAAQDLPGVAIALLDGDAVVWQAGFGELQAASVVRVASISKLFNAVAVMDAVQRGQLDLDRPVREYVDEFQPTGSGAGQVNLRHLLSHRSGVLREPGTGHYFEEGHSLRDLVLSLSDRPLVYEPGQRFKYSNAGVSVAGFALEEAVRVPYANHLRRRVLEPLGMADSSFEADSAAAQRCAPAWMWTVDGRRFTAPGFELGMTPAANLYTTMPDLLRFARSLCVETEGPRVLEPDVLEQMFAPQFGDDGMGLGFFLGDLDGHRTVGHGGAIYGFASQLTVLPDSGLAAAVVTNLDFANGSAERLATMALRRLLGQRQGMTPRRGFPELQAMGAEAAQTLAGRYGTPEGWVDLQARGEELWAQPSLGTPMRLVRSDSEVLRWDPLQASLGARMIEPAEGGILLRGNFLPAVPDAEPLPAPAAYADFLGEYGWDHNVLYVFEDFGRLCCLIEWFARYPLLAHREKQDLWRMPDRGLYAGERVRFERDESGAVVACHVGAVRFPRRAVGTAAGETFRIEPLHDAATRQKMAAAARMPREEGEFRDAELVSLASVDPELRFDVRYAGDNNFMGTAFYPEDFAVRMQAPAAEALKQAHAALREQGYGLVIYDAFRPWSVTKMFWDATPESMKDFVANPNNGSRHNRGCAVDLGLVRLEDGSLVDMVSGYDEFTPRAFPHYPGGTWSQRWHRDLLRRAMEDAGFSVYEWEWWHFDYKDWRQYALNDW